MCVIAIQCDLRLVAQSCLTLCDPMDCSPPCSSVHGDSSGKNIGVDCHTLLQGIFPTQNLTQVSCIAGRFFTIWATRGDYQHTSIRKEPGYTTLRLWIPAFIYDIESSYFSRKFIHLVFQKALYFGSQSFHISLILRIWKNAEWNKCVFLQIELFPQVNHNSISCWQKMTLLKNDL